AGRDARERERQNTADGETDYVTERLGIADSHEGFRPEVGVGASLIDVGPEVLIASVGELPLTVDDDVASRSAAGDGQDAEGGQRGGRQLAHPFSPLRIRCVLHAGAEAPQWVEVQGE